MTNEMANVNFAVTIPVMWKRKQLKAFPFRPDGNNASFIHPL